MLTPSGEPTRSQLRVFSATSLLVGGVFLLLAWRSSPLVWNRPSSLWLAALFIPLGVLGSIFPEAVRGAYKVGMLITRPIGFVVAQIILALLFFLVVVPLGLALRLFGHDPLRRKAPGAWVPVTPDPPSTGQDSRRRYLRQY